MNERKSLLTSPQLDQHEQHALALTPKQIFSLYKRSKSSGIPLDLIEEVYYRGYEAAETNKEQAGFARVDSFIHGGEAFLLDQDLVEAVTQGEPQTDDPAKPSSRFIGSDSLTKIYKENTPGQTRPENKADLIKRVVQDKVKTQTEGVKHVVGQMGRDAIKAAMPGYARALSRYRAALKKKKRP